MSDSIARFHKRKEALRQAAAGPQLVLLPPAAEVSALLATPIDHAFVDAPGASARFEQTWDDSSQDAQKLLDDLAAGHDAHRFGNMVNELQQTVLQTVANSFGVGKLLSAYDKTGGSVDTIHNVSQGVYATDAERQRYDDRGDYDKAVVDAAHQHEKYERANRSAKSRREQGTLVDDYTGKPIPEAHKNDRQLKNSLDHVVSVKDVHDDRRRVLAGLDTAELSNVEENHANTVFSINSAKKADRAAKVKKRLEEQAPKRRARLAELEGRQDAWSDKERKEYNKLRSQEDIDINEVATREAEADAAITNEVNKAYYTSAKFARATLTAGAADGAKMGMQQALGVVVVEFLAGALAEVKDLYRLGRSEATFLDEARVRLERVGRRVAKQWKQALRGMRDGFISGLLSSLATTLINAFVTTGARMVRMIREGFSSLLRAVKLLVLRPQDMTRQQALHEASKIMVGTLALVGGIALEEVLSKQLALVVGPGLIADAAGAAIAGALTAIATSFAVYLLDKADLFGVNATARVAAVGAELDKRLAASIAVLEASDGAPQLRQAS